MNWKEFLKPDWRKIVLTIILVYLASLPELLGTKTTINGLPIPFLINGIEFLYHYLVIDIIFWYLFSCLIIWIYDKIKKR